MHYKGNNIRWLSHRNGGSLQNGIVALECRTGGSIWSRLLSHYFSKNAFNSI